MNGPSVSTGPTPQPAGLVACVNCRHWLTREGDEWVHLDGGKRSCFGFGSSEVATPIARGGSR